jgi:hypothetical protein
VDVVSEYYLLVFIPAGGGPRHTCVSTGRSPFQPTAAATAAAAS